MTRFLPACVALAALIGAGLVHGFWTDRWSLDTDLARAADSLQRLPSKVGDWEGTDLDQKVTNQGLAGQLYRRYVNKKNPGDVVTLALVCGRAGRVSIHTPDVCYGVSGFRVGRKTVFKIEGGGTSPAEFFTAEATKTSNADPTRLRIFWTWLGKDGWRVADDPRQTFGGQKVLFKFYLIRETGAPVEVDQDPTVDLLRQLLPEMEKVLETPAT